MNLRRYLSSGKRRGRGAIQRSKPYLLAGRTVHCPVCDRSFRRFIAHRGRPHAKCPNCGALERHRMLWGTLDALGECDSVLHFAPEQRIAERLRADARERYVGVDLKPGFDCRLDITALPFADESFDRIVCCHVLEHIPEDLTAMKEFRRVLRANGAAIIQVPLQRTGPTAEDFTLKAAQRALQYGQEDHVRMYGMDIKERLVSAGLDVTEVDEIGDSTAASTKGQILFHCRRA